ncbi:N-acetylmuramoyl-L-alanine amidase [Bacillus cereus]|nr:N-acetylmuramoyl-L-alanine amidase [Bacillus cereus]
MIAFIFALRCTVLCVSLKLTTYDSIHLSSWRDTDVVGTIDAGLGFTVDAKVSVNGSTQYQVYNSKRKTFYVKGNEA